MALIQVAQSGKERGPSKLEKIALALGIAEKALGVGLAVPEVIQRNKQAREAKERADTQLKIDVATKLRPVEEGEPGFTLPGSEEQLTRRESPEELNKKLLRGPVQPGTLNRFNQTFQGSLSTEGLTEQEARELILKRQEQQSKPAARITEPDLAKTFVEVDPGTEGSFSLITDTGRSVSVRPRQTVEKEEKAKKLSDVQTKNVADLDAGLSKLQNALALKVGKNIDTGPFIGRVPEILKGTDRITMEQDINQGFDLYRVATTGAAAAEKELKILKTRLPQPTDNDLQFNAKSRGAIKGFKLVRALFLDNLRKQGKDVSKFITEADEALIQEGKVRGKVVDEIFKANEWLVSNPDDPRAEQVKLRVETLTKSLFPGE